MRASLGIDDRPSRRPRTGRIASTRRDSFDRHDVKRLHESAAGQLYTQPLI